jgi:hypothetical protein
MLVSAVSPTASPKEQVFKVTVYEKNHSPATIESSVADGSDVGPAVGAAVAGMSGVLVTVGTAV